jgi:hypothetical protein
VYLRHIAAPVVALWQTIEGNPACHAQVTCTQTLKACKRPCSSGGGTYNVKSKRPGLHTGHVKAASRHHELQPGKGSKLLRKASGHRVRAASSACGRLVAPITNIPSARSNPSISERRDVRRRALRSAPRSCDERLPGHIAGGKVLNGDHNPHLDNSRSRQCKNTYQQSNPPHPRKELMVPPVGHACSKPKSIICLDQTPAHPCVTHSLEAVPQQCLTLPNVHAVQLCACLQGQSVRKRHVSRCLRT